MNITKDKVRENLLRRIAERRGLKLQKSFRRDPMALGFGRWRLMAGKKLAFGSLDWAKAATLEEVEAYLTKGRRRR